MAALLALSLSSENGFRGIANFASSCVLQRGLVYRRKKDNKCFLSLGFVQYVTLAFNLEEIKHNNESYFRFPVPSTMHFDERIDCLQFLHCSTLSGSDVEHGKEEYAGIPFEVCLLVPVNSRFYVA